MATPTTQFPPLLPRSDLNLTTTDVLIARLILRGLQLRALPRLPEEIAQHILSLAAYRPRTVRHCVAPREYPIDGLWQREAAGPVARVAGLYMTTDPLPRSCRGATRVTLQARGAHVPLCGVWVPDDGGSGRFATYHVRETWLEVCVLRRANDDDDDDDGAVGTVDVGEDSRLESVVTTTFRSLDGAAQDLHERGWDIVSRPIGGWKSPGFVEPDRSMLLYASLPCARSFLNPRMLHHCLVHSFPT